MSGKQTIGVAITCFVFFIAIFVALFSPLADGLFAPGNDTADDVIGLLLAILVLYVIAILAVTFTIACCQLAKRLGYDQSAEVLLLVPPADLFINSRITFEQGLVVGVTSLGALFSLTLTVRTGSRRKVREA